MKIQASPFSGFDSGNRHPLRYFPSLLAQIGLRFSLLTLLALLAVRPVAAFNSIHEASYHPLARGKSPASLGASIGAIYSPEVDILQLPLGLWFEVSPQWELGAAMKTQWLSEGDHLPFLVFGTKILTGRAGTVSADLVLSATGGSHGLALGLYRSTSWSSRFSSAFSTRLGLMEALAIDKALAAMEIAWYPALRLQGGSSFEIGIIGSSQTRGFEEHLAIDLQPALKVAAGRGSEVFFGAGWGLAGARKEGGVRLKLVFASAL